MTTRNTVFYKVRRHGPGEAYMAVAAVAGAGEAERVYRTLVWPAYDMFHPMTLEVETAVLAAFAPPTPALTSDAGMVASLS